MFTIIKISPNKTNTLGRCFTTKNNKKIIIITDPYDKMILSDKGLQRSLLFNFFSDQMLFFGFQVFFTLRSFLSLSDPLHKAFAVNTMFSTCCWTKDTAYARDFGIWYLVQADIGRQQWKCSACLVMLSLSIPHHSQLIPGPHGKSGPKV